jgi:hypothetical protein
MYMYERLFGRLISGGVCLVSIPVELLYIGMEMWISDEPRTHYLVTNVRRKQRTG